MPAGREDEFVTLWSKVNRYMRSQPGYVSHRLHRSVQAESRFRFVNVAQWDSAVSWQAAHDAGFRALVAQPAWADFPSTETLCEVVAEDHA